MKDPVVTNPELYRVMLENERVRVLEYRDVPGDKRASHRHPDTVMVTLTSFARRISAAEQQVEVTLEQGQVRWGGAQEHAGGNIGDTPTHANFEEVKEGATNGAPMLGPTSG